MSDQNWQLKEGDPFAVPDIKARLRIFGREGFPIALESADRIESLEAKIAMIESEAEQLRMSVHNARIEVTEASKDAKKWRGHAAALARIDEELPDGWLIQFEMAPDEWAVLLLDPDANNVDYCSNDVETDTDMILAALDHAITAAMKEKA